MDNITEHPNHKMGLYLSSAMYYNCEFCTYIAVEVQQITAHRDISEGDTLTNKEGTASQVLVHDAQAVLDGLFCLFCVLQ